MHRERDEEKEGWMEVGWIVALRVALYTINDAGDLKKKKREKKKREEDSFSNNYCPC